MYHCVVTFVIFYSFYTFVIIPFFISLFFFFSPFISSVTSILLCLILCHSSTWWLTPFCTTFFIVYFLYSVSWCIHTLLTVVLYKYPLILNLDIPLLTVSNPIILDLTFFSNANAVPFHHLLSVSTLYSRMCFFLSFHPFLFHLVSFKAIIFIFFY